MNLTWNRDRRSNLTRRLRDRDRGYWYRFYGGASEAEIAGAEAQLGVELPPSFRWFLQEFGAAELRVPIFGVRASDPRTVVAESQMQRRREDQPLPAHLIVFAEESTFLGLANGGWAKTSVCFDTSRPANPEYPIVRWDPRARSGRHLKRAGKSFLDWLGHAVREAERQTGIPSPLDWSDADGWERYWTRVLADRDRALSMALPWFPRESQLLRLLESLHERGFRRILFAGNGISLEPYFFAHCGYEATALDLSLTASRFVEGFPLDADALARFLPAFRERKRREFGTVHEFDPARSRERVARAHRPGGKVTVITADLFTYSPEQPFHVIVSKRSFHGFSESDQHALARCFFDWLRPSGVCVVQTLNAFIEGEQPVRRMEDVFREVGFFECEESARWRYEHALPEDAHRLSEYQEQADRERLAEARRLDAGEKMVGFWHESG